MSNLMSAVVCHGPRNYQLEEVVIPVPSRGEALIKVEAVGICASDLKCYHGAAKFWGDENRPAWAETEVIPGHEFVGEVVEIDEEGIIKLETEGFTGKSCVDESQWIKDIIGEEVSRHLKPCYFINEKGKLVKKHLNLCTLF